MAKGFWGVGNSYGKSTSVLIVIKMISVWILGQNEAEKNILIK